MNKTIYYIVAAWTMDWCTIFVAIKFHKDPMIYDKWHCFDLEWPKMTLLWAWKNSSLSKVYIHKVSMLYSKRYWFDLLWPLMTLRWPWKKSSLSKVHTYQLSMSYLLPYGIDLIWPHMTLTWPFTTSKFIGGVDLPIPLLPIKFHQHTP